MRPEAVLSGNSPALKDIEAARKWKRGTMREDGEVVKLTEGVEVVDRRF